MSANRKKSVRPPNTGDYIVQLIRESRDKPMTRGRLFQMLRARDDAKRALRQLVALGIVEEVRPKKLNMSGPKPFIVQLRRRE